MTLLRLADEWLSDTRALVGEGGQRSSPSLPPRGELRYLTFKVDELGTRLEDLLYALSLDEGSWIAELSVPGYPSAAHLRFLVYEDTSIVVELLNPPDQKTPEPENWRKRVRALGWEEPTASPTPVWHAGTPSTHRDVAGVVAMVVATLCDGLSLKPDRLLELALFGAPVESRQSP